VVFTVTGGRDGVIMGTFDGDADELGEIVGFGIAVVEIAVGAGDFVGLVKG